MRQRGRHLLITLILLGLLTACSSQGSPTPQRATWNQSIWGQSLWQ